MFEPTINDPATPEWTVGPTEHLSWQELACHDMDSTAYPQDYRGSRAVILAHEFEWIRHLCGDLPIKIGSAYRTLTWNTKVGSKKTSQHVQGRALDLHPPKGQTSVDLLQLVLERSHMSESRIKGIGLYRWGVHIDTRGSSRLARWRGGRVRADVA